MFIPNYYTQVDNGVWQRTQPVSSFDFYNKEHNLESFINVLHADKSHYNNLNKVIAEKRLELSKPYKNVVSIGGGCPKFEIEILKATNISIIDICPEFYQKAMPYFKEIYNIPETVTIKYLKQFITEPFAVDNTDCVAFIHFLEHQNTFEQVKKWIQRQKNDIIIYGPNIEASKDANWFHFGDNTIDHNVFFTIDAIMKVGTDAGFSCSGFAYSDDMLVWLKR